MVWVGLGAGILTWALVPTQNINEAKATVNIFFI